jgi:hypothetical protein
MSTGSSLPRYLYYGTTKERAMTIIAMIIMWGFVAVAFAVLNTGPMDKEANRREEYWARYERK